MQDFFQLILKMSSSTSKLQKRVVLAPLYNKKWAACSDTKAVSNNHETQSMLSHLTLCNCLFKLYRVWRTFKHFLKIF